MEYPDGSVGKKVEIKNYIKHLIDRYNEFKETDVGKGNLNYAGIYGAIKKEFKASAFKYQNINLVTYQFICKEGLTTLV